MEDTIVEVLEISMKCRTSKNEVKTILLTSFCDTQRVTLEMENKKVTLIIEGNENE